MAEEKSKNNTSKQNEKTEKTAVKAEKDNSSFPDLKPGMTIRIFQKIKEMNTKGQEKERIQYFEGRIIALKHGKEKGATVTVRKVSDGVGVEKIFPLQLPTIEKIEIKKTAKVRRAKLYYLKRDYKKRVKDKIFTSK